MLHELTDLYTAPTAKASIKQQQQQGHCQMKKKLMEDLRIRHIRGPKHVCIFFKFLNEWPKIVSLLCHNSCIQFHQTPYSG
jgi:hypothetical protein